MPRIIIIILAICGAVGQDTETHVKAKMSSWSLGLLGWNSFVSLMPMKGDRTPL